MKMKGGIMHAHTSERCCAILHRLHDQKRECRVWKVSSKTALERERRMCQRSPLHSRRERWKSRLGSSGRIRLLLLFHPLSIVQQAKLLQEGEYNDLVATPCFPRIELVTCRERSLVSDHLRSPVPGWMQVEHMMLKIQLALCRNK